MPFDLGFLSDSRIPVIQITSSVDRGQREHPNSDWDEFYVQNHRKKILYNFVVLSFSF